jgi:glycosyltransferase involved in cell wall biosynthesis
VTRVLLLTSHPLGPPWDSADKQLAAAVARHVPEVRFCVLDRLGGPRSGLGDWRLPVWSRSGQPGRLAHAQVAAFGLAAEPAVDLVHAVVTIGPGFGRLARWHRRLPARLRRPVLHTAPGVTDPATLASAVPLGPTVALSEATAALLRDAGFGDVRVVPPGIPLERWPMRPRPSGGPPMVLFAGHHDPGGGAEEALRGMAAACQATPTPARLVLAMRSRPGQDARREAARLRALAGSLGLAGVELLGHVADMPSLIREATLVVLPARTLAGKADLPLVVLEAMAAGRPVVVSRLPSLATLGGAVTSVPPGSPAALGVAVAGLLDDPARWRAMAAAGRRAVEARFSEQAMAASYARLYAELCRRPLAAGAVAR